MPKATLDAYRYAGEILLPALGLARHPFVVQSPGSGGTSSRAFKVVIERGPALLLRIFDDAARARRTAAALRHLEKRGVPAPRLKHADLSPVNRIARRNGFPLYATAETWIDGVRALEAPNPESVAMLAAELLARFHAISRSRWGRPGGLPELRPYAATLMAQALALLSDLEARRILDEREAGAARARVLGWKPALMRIGTFHLCHNDANRRNFILTPEKALVAVDVRRISYEPCAEEVANALYHFCRSDASLAARFLERYLKSATPSCRTTWERAGAFYTFLNTLKRLHRRTGPQAATVVHEDETAPGAPPGVDARIPQWKEAILTLTPPPRVWPEPGSPPPAGLQLT
jgi:Ser/Thr protein kinase RdoA (MazF antagonist)